jgi:hypothetical protein
MEIVWRIFLAAGCVQNARNRPAGLVLTLRDIAADGEWARLTIIQPDNFTTTTALAFANMKSFPGHKQTWFQSSTPVYLALVVGVLLFAGCGKAKKSAAETPASSPESVKQAETDHLPVATPTPAAAPALATAPNGEPDLKELDRSLLRWLMRNRRKPASFEDFSATAGVAIPPPPAGKKYVIAKNMHIQLVDR